MARLARLFVILNLVGLCAISSAAPATPDAVSLVPADYRHQLTQRLSVAEDRRDQWVDVITRAKPEQREGVAFLLVNMPERDLKSLDPATLLKNVELAYEIRSKTPWAASVPADIFLNDVLPYANLNERRDDWRADFVGKFLPLVKDCHSTGEAAQVLNREIFKVLNVKYHATKRPKPDQSPYESTEAGYASCSGLSILLVDACRAVGVPARVVGTPLWSNGSGNHTWVEIWDGQWRFIGAAEPGPFNQTWFGDLAAKADLPDHGVYAASFRQTGKSFPLVWDPKNIDYPAIDVTGFYAKKQYLNVVAQKPASTKPSDLDGDWAKMRAITPRGYVCLRAMTPIEIDGKGDEPAWAAAPWTENFVDIEGDARPSPRFRTRAQMLWDDDHLYIHAELQEPHVWGTITKRNEVIFQDNDFEVFIDPDGDNHHYHEFEMNALNTIWELTLDKPYRDGGPAIDPVNIKGLRSAVHVDGTLNDPKDTDRSWSVEISIPWKGLADYAGSKACPPLDGDQWRMNFSRVEWLVDLIDGKYHKIPKEMRAEDNWIWSAQGVIDMHRPERWGFVQFSRSAETATFQPDKTLAARDALMAVYYRQREYIKRNGHYAATAAEIGLAPEGACAMNPVEIELKEDGYIATTPALGAGTKNRTLHLRQDSKLWEERNQ